MSYRALLCLRIPLAAILLCLGGCFAIPISDVPHAADRSAEVVVVRESFHTGRLVSHYLLLDGIIIARLRNSEYTSFTVSEGVHTLEVQWQIPFTFYGPYKVAAQFEARVGGNYLFMAFMHQAPPKVPPGADPDYSRGVSFSQLVWNEHDLRIKDKNFVAPGR